MTDQRNFLTIIGLITTISLITTVTLVSSAQAAVPPPGLPGIVWGSPDTTSGDSSTPLKTTNCADLLAQFESRSFALDQVAELNDLENKVESLRKNNGQYERTTSIERARRFHFLRQALMSGNVGQITNTYRQLFRDVELAYYTIIHHQKALADSEGLYFKSGSTQQKHWQNELDKMFFELQEAYINFGEGLVEYRIVRHELEKEISKEGRGYTKFIATKALEGLGHADVSARFPDLGLNAKVRPDLDKMSQLFKTQIEPVIALLKKEIREESRVRTAKWRYWGLTTLQKAIMAVGQFKLGPWQVGGPKVQALLGAFFLMSRDKFLLTNYLHKVETLVAEADHPDEQVKLTLEFCNSDCDELLETFARLGYMSEDWLQLKTKINALSDEVPQYRRLKKLLAEAEKTAENLHGLSLNYHELRDDREMQFVLSSALTTFYTLVLTTSASEWAQWIEQGKAWIMAFFS